MIQPLATEISDNDNDDGDDDDDDDATMSTTFIRKKFKK